MTLHTEALSDQSIIALDPTRRLLVEPWENAHGRRYVTIVPQHQDRSGAWRLSHSGLIITPDVARELAPTLLAVAAHIDAGPVDPMPTAEDREGSRWP